MFSRELLAVLAEFPTGTLSDALGRTGTMAHAIKPLTPGMRCLGPAFTVRCYPADNLSLHRALELASPGEVLVVDGGDVRDTALVGELMVYAAKLRGLAGMVIQGAVRDAAGIRDLSFPVFASAVAPRGPVKETLGALGVPIQCGGIPVRPGDLVAGDDDGVVVIPAEEAKALLERARAIREKEEAVRRGLEAGQSTVDLLGLRGKLKG